MRLVKSILLLTLLLWGCDLIIGTWFGNLYHKGDSNLADLDQTYVIEKSSDQIIILGSSRASHHYIPSLITDSLHKTCFNAGRDGHFIMYSNILLNCILNRYKPQTIILDINPDEFNSIMNSKTQKDRIISSLLPYVNSNVVAKNTVKKLDIKEYVLAELFKTYAYNSDALRIITSKLKRQSNDPSKGYRPLSGSKIKLSVTYDTTTYTRSDTLITVLNTFCETCRKHNVDLIIVSSPTLIYKTHFNDTRIIQSIARKYNYRYINMAYDSSFSNPSLYYNDVHLDDSGAKIFTSKLIPYLRADSSLAAKI